MNGVFTDRATKVFQLANRAATRHWHDYIGPEHILWGLIDGHDNNACHVLRFLKIDPEDLRKILEELIIRGPQPTEEGRRPHTPQAKKLTESAIVEAREMTDELVGPEHVLLGCLHDQKTLAYQVLACHDVKIDAVREAIRTLRDSPQLIPPVPERPSQASPRSQARRWPTAILLFAGVVLAALVNGGFQFYSHSYPTFDSSVDNRIKPGTPHDLWSPLESGPIAFRSWNGRWQGADDTDIIFKWDKVFLVEYSEGVRAYAGTYHINNDGEITLQVPEFEEEFKTTWPVMLLQRQGHLLHLVPKDPGNDFVTKKRDGVPNQNGQADYWSFRPISLVAGKKLLAEVEQLERRKKATADPPTTNGGPTGTHTE